MHLLFVFERYQKFLMHLEKKRNFWYISAFSDTYQKFRIHIKILWYISKFYDTYQKFLIHMFLDVKTWLVSEFLIHTSLGDTICVKTFQIEWFWKLFSHFLTHIVHIHHNCTSCFSNMSWTIKQHASTSHLHMHFKTNLLSTQIPVKVGDFAQCMC